MLRHPSSPRLSVQNEKFLQREIPWGHSGTVMFSSSFLCTPCHLQYSYSLKGHSFLRGEKKGGRRRKGKKRKEKRGRRMKERRGRKERGGEGEDRKEETKGGRCGGKKEGKVIAHIQFIESFLC